MPPISRVPTRIYVFKYSDVAVTSAWEQKKFDRMSKSSSWLILYMRLQADSSRINNHNRRLNQEIEISQISSNYSKRRKHNET